MSKQLFLCGGSFWVIGEIDFMCVGSALIFVVQNQQVLNSSDFLHLYHGSLPSSIIESNLILLFCQIRSSPKNQLCEVHLIGKQL